MKKKTKRKISVQKIFCFISFIFILTCCLWYGGRFVYFYLDSKKIPDSKKTVFADTLKKENHSNQTFRKDKEIYYFYQEVTNNYLKYSNIIWRIVKINEDNSITLISDESLTKLAYGTKELDYSNNTIINWLNKNNSSTDSGILENQFKNISKYLTKNNTCTDNIDDVEKITCEKENKDYYFGLLSVEDYIKTGGKKSFIKKDYPTYLANSNSKKQIWYIDEEGNLNQSLGDDLLSIRPTITLSPTIEIKSGNGTEQDPYTIEEEKNYFASYIKLDNDIWRVYSEDNTNIKLILIDYIKDKNDSKYTSKYGTNNYRHNDTVYNSLAYYLNHTYLNSLSYKNNILNTNYYNGYFGEDNDYELKELFLDEIDTKVALPSIGDVIFNENLDNFFTSTGLYKNSTSVYLIKTNEVTTKKITSEASVVPCITINKSIITKGNGTKEDPYTTE